MPVAPRAERRTAAVVRGQVRLAAVLLVTALTGMPTGTAAIAAPAPALAAADVPADATDPGITDATTGQAAGAPPGSVLAFRVGDPAVTESSGLVASRLHDGVVWTHNDGDEGVLYAVGGDGRTIASFRLAGIDTRDWEGLGYGTDERGRPALYVADIGDNSGRRDLGTLVHRVTEPATLDGGTLPASTYRLRYPESPVDAEALLVEPATGQVRVVTKGLLGGSVYAAPQPLDPDGPNVLERVGDAPALVTDGAYLDDGRYVLRDYGAAYVFTADGEEVGAFELPAQEQGESLTITPDGQSVLVGSEGVESPVWRVPLPEDVLFPAASSPAASTPVPPDGPSAADDGGSEEFSAGTSGGAAPVPPWALGALAAGLLTLVLAGVRAVRRH